jgi:hypothetical protein
VQIMDRIEGINGMSLPWERQLDGPTRRKIGIFKRIVCLLLSRNPADRPTMAQFVAKCDSMLVQSVTEIDLFQPPARGFVPTQPVPAQKAQTLPRQQPRISPSPPTATRTPVSPQQIHRHPSAPQRLQHAPSQLKRASNVVAASRYTPQSPRAQPSGVALMQLEEMWNRVQELGMAAQNFVTPDFSGNISMDSSLVRMGLRVA